LLVQKWTIQTHGNESEIVFGFHKQICLSHSEIIFNVIYANKCQTFGRTSAERSVSLPKPSASAECHNLTFGSSLVFNVQVLCSPCRVFFSEFTVPVWWYETVHALKQYCICVICMHMLLFSSHVQFCYRCGTQFCKFRCMSVLLL